MSEFQHYHNRPGIEVVFSNGNETLSLFYVVYEWPSAQKFYSLVKHSIENNHVLEGATSFTITEQDEQRLISDINELIVKVNATENINIPLMNTSTDLNHLHFVLTPVAGIYWADVNDKIHEYEQYLAQKGKDPRANALFRYPTTETIPLEQQDTMFFVADRAYGDLCLNYTLQGKHWLELQTDNDIESLENGLLKPEVAIAAQGYMMFRPPSPSPFFRLNKFLNWYNDAFKDRPISYEMAIGYLLLGKLVMPSSWNNYYSDDRNTWTRFLCQHKKIIDVKLLHITEDMVPTLLNKSKML